MQTLALTKLTRQERNAFDLALVRAVVVARVRAMCAYAVNVIKHRDSNPAGSRFVWISDHSIRGARPRVAKE